MSDPRPKTIHEKLDGLQNLVERVADHVIRLDQNTLVLAGRLDAIEPEITSIKPSVDQLQRAVVHVAGDVQDIRQRLFEEADRTDKRFKGLEHGTSNGTNGHG